MYFVYNVPEKENKKGFLRERKIFHKLRYEKLVRFFKERFE